MTSSLLFQCNSSKKEELPTKSGETVKQLKLTPVSANLDYVTNFISGFLPSFIHHRNQLRHYRSSLQTFRKCYETIQCTGHMNGEGSYHISNGKKHVQHFVLEEKLGDVDSSSADYLVIENCSSQYKTCTHFESVHHLGNQHNKKIIRLLGIPEHGKGEVIHVGGTVKTTIKRGVASGIKL